MATVYKRLGAANGNATISTANTLYNVPANTEAVISTITVCNRDATANTFSLCVSTTSSFALDGYITYQTTVAGNDTLSFTFGLTLSSPSSYLLYSSSSANMSFNAFGSEIS